jgi:hypothetical protein
MLEAEVDRECVFVGTLSWALEMVGEGITEFDRE